MASVNRTDGATGIGIVEHDGDGETARLYSLYYDNRLSNRDAAVDVLTVVYNLLDDDETAFVDCGGMRMKYSWAIPYSGKITAESRKRRKRFQEVELLAIDGIERMETIIEKLL